MNIPITTVRLFLLSSVCLLGVLHVNEHAAGDDQAIVTNADSVSEDVLRTAFASIHDGWSVDELLIRSELRASFVQRVQDTHPHLAEDVILSDLLALRKRGRLNVPTTRSDRSDTTAQTQVAEIAARRVIDEFGGSLDDIFVIPVRLARFDAIVQQIAPETETYAARKAAMRLRKTRRLRPELLSRVTDWKVEIVDRSVADFSNNLPDISPRPGVYIFRDSSGYLYIGQSKNLRDRLEKHLAQSDRLALAAYLGNTDLKSVTLELHVFAAGSPAEETVVREAYESELIRTRQPRLNLAP